jgi:LysR family transcriptional activator of nhaA
MYKVNFNHLYYFITIANLGSIVKASEVLNVTQPALSHQLRQLEEDLGQKLFDRKGRGLIVNEFGKKVYNHANKIFREADQMFESLKPDTYQKKRVIQVGVISWLPTEYTFQFLKGAHSNPRIKVVIENGFPAEMISLLKQDKLDVILSDSPYSGRSSLISSQKISSSKIVCIAHPSFSKQSQKFPQYLDSHKITSYHSSSQMRTLIDSFLTKNNVSPEITTITNDVNFMLKLVSKGPTLAFIPMEAAKEYIKEKKVIKAKVVDSLTLDIWAITKKENEFSGLIAKSINNFKS